MPHKTLLPLLKTLRFNGMLSQFDEVVDMTAATEKEIGLMQRFLEIEIAYRQARSLGYRTKIARLPQIKSIDQFDCSETPLQPECLNHLESCQFIDKKHNILLIGGSGTGKTHVALALAYTALQKQFRVRFYLFSDLARHLLRAKERGYEANFMSYIQRFNLLVIDEMGYLPIDQQAGHLLFELFSKLYEKTSLIITTHLTFDEWTPLFNQAKTSKALIDRITHHC